MTNLREQLKARREKDAAGYAANVVSPAICPGCPDSVWQIHAKIDILAGATPRDELIAKLADALRYVGGNCERIQYEFDQNGVPNNCEEYEHVVGAIEKIKIQLAELDRFVSGEK